MRSLCHAALSDLAGVVDKLDEAGLGRVVDEIAVAGSIALFGVGREGLQIRGLCMRLFHLGLPVAMVGDMTTPALGKDGLLIVSAGPGGFSTVNGLIGVAKAAGARVMVVTAQPHGTAAALADCVLHIPAQTMADDHRAKPSTLPMGSLFEGAQYLIFEILVLALRDRLAVAPEAMRARHTNLE